jgi:hypothetical protein
MDTVITVLSVVADERSGSLPVLLRDIDEQFEPQLVVIGNAKYAP